MAGFGEKYIITIMRSMDVGGVESQMKRKFCFKTEYCMELINGTHLLSP